MRAWCCFFEEETGYRVRLSLVGFEKLIRSMVLGFSKVSLATAKGQTAVIAAKGTKCDRCWNFFASVVKTPAGNFCPRCARAYDRYVKEHPEEPERR